MECMKNLVLSQIGLMYISRVMAIGNLVENEKAKLYHCRTAEIVGNVCEL